MYTFCKLQLSRVSKPTKKKKVATQLILKLKRTFRYGTRALTIQMHGSFAPDAEKNSRHLSASTSFSSCEGNC